MIVENLVTIVFTQDEVIEAMKALMSCKMNDLVAGTPEHTRRENILAHLHDTTSRIEVEEDRYQLMIDGVASSEEF